ncbi:hypothetical protein N7535_000403 [Penicillium sp. DV-2018c]|nr:hypothetical protein N7461_006350 [Penicillium sp. DV-2018c]KAJ5581783.1 hypothetical protein N7535_000403 [Penicillium sp. DV-2018c]
MHNFMTAAHHSPEGHGKPIGMQKLLRDQNIAHDTKTRQLIDGQGNVVDFADMSSGVPYLVELREQPTSSTRGMPDDSESNEEGIVDKATAYEQLVEWEAKRETTLETPYIAGLNGRSMEGRHHAGDYRLSK